MYRLNRSFLIILIFLGFGWVSHTKAQNAVLIDNKDIKVTTKTNTANNNGKIVYVGDDGVTHVPAPNPDNGDWYKGRLTVTPKKASEHYYLKIVESEEPDGWNTDFKGSSGQESESIYISKGESKDFIIRFGTPSTSSNPEKDYDIEIYQDNFLNNKVTSFEMPVTSDADPPAPYIKNLNEIQGDKNVTITWGAKDNHVGASGVYSTQLLKKETDGSWSLLKSTVRKEDDQTYEFEGKPGYQYTFKVVAEDEVQNEKSSQQYTTEIAKLLANKPGGLKFAKKKETKEFEVYSNVSWNVKVEYKGDEQGWLDVTSDGR